MVRLKDRKGIQTLIDLLKHKNKNIQGDAIKVLCEVGNDDPSLIQNYINDFVTLLDHKNNRLAWGGMISLNYMTTVDPGAIYKLLPKLADAANKGSVITRDNFVRLLIKLEAIKKYSGKVSPLVLEQMTTCPTNQLPMYAEEAIPVVHAANRNAFIELLRTRIDEFETGPKKKRLAKVIETAS